MLDEGCCENRTVLMKGWLHFFSLRLRGWLVLCVALPVCVPVFAMGYRPTFGGASSRAALARRVKGQQVVVHAKSYDQYGRTIARVTLGGEDIGEWMVKQGNAWAYYYRVGYGPYTAYQRQAQAAHRGVFVSGDPMAPSLFRRQHGSCH